MNENIDNKIISMTFDNRQFERNISNTIQSLKDLQDQINGVPNSSKTYDGLANSTRNYSKEAIRASANTSELSLAFNSLEVMGVAAIARITNDVITLGTSIAKKLMSPINQMISGGSRRAMNIENAKFQLKGLEVEWNDISDSINYGVKDTAYGLDSAARVASQLVASGVKYFEYFDDALGENVNDMKTALRAISGVAAMTNSTYDDIGSIFTTVSGQGKVMTMQLRQLEARGLNVAAQMGKTLGHTESEIRDMVSKGEVDFKMFSRAMDEAFGAHAKQANDTYTGSLSNVKAALSRIGAEFASPWFTNMTKVFNAIIPVLNSIKSALKPIVNLYTIGLERIVNQLSTVLSDTDLLEGLKWVLVDIYQFIHPVFNALYEFRELNLTTIKPLFKSFKEAAKGAQIFGDKAIIIKNITTVLINSALLAKDMIVSIFSIVGTGFRTVLSFFTNVNDETNTTLRDANDIIYTARKIIKAITPIVKAKLEKKIKEIGIALSNIDWKEVINALIKIASVLSTILPIVIKLIAPVINFIARVINGTENIGDTIKKVGTIIVGVIGGVVLFLTNQVKKVSSAIQTIFDAIPSSKNIDVTYKESRDRTAISNSHHTNQSIKSLKEEQSEIDRTSNKMDELSSHTIGAAGSGILLGQIGNANIIDMSKMIDNLTEATNEYSNSMETVASSGVILDAQSKKTSSIMGNLSERIHKIGEFIKGVFESLYEFISSLEIPWKKILGIGGLTIVVASIVGAIAAIPAAIFSLLSSLATLAGGYAISNILSAATGFINEVGTALLKLVIATAIYSLIPIEKLNAIPSILDSIGNSVINLATAISRLYYAIAILEAILIAKSIYKWIKEGKPVKERFETFGSILKAIFETIAKVSLMLAASIALVVGAINSLKDSSGNIDQSKMKELKTILSIIGGFVVAMAAVTTAINGYFNKVKNVYRGENVNERKTTFQLMTNNIDTSSLMLFGMAALMGTLMAGVYAISKVTESANTGKIVAIFGGATAVLAVILFGIAQIFKSAKFNGGFVKESFDKTYITTLSSSLMMMLKPIILLIGAMSLYMYSISKIGNFTSSQWATFGVTMAFMAAALVMVGMYITRMTVAGQSIAKSDSGNVYKLAATLKGLVDPITNLLTSMVMLLLVVVASSFMIQIADPSSLFASVAILGTIMLFVLFFFNWASRITKTLDSAARIDTGAVRTAIKGIQDLLLSMALLLVSVGLVSALPNVNWGTVLAAFAGMAIFIGVLLYFVNSNLKIIQSSAKLSFMAKEIGMLSLLVLSLAAIIAVIGLINWNVSSIAGLLIALVSLTAVLYGTYTFIKHVQKLKLTKGTGVESVLLALIGILGAVALLIAVIGLIDWSTLDLKCLAVLVTVTIIVGGLVALAAYIVDNANSVDIPMILSILGSMAVFIISLGVTMLIMSKAAETFSGISDSSLESFWIVSGAIALLTIIAMILLAFAPLTANAALAMIGLASFVTSLGIACLLISESMSIISNITTNIGGLIALGSMMLYILALATIIVVASPAIVAAIPALLAIEGFMLAIAAVGVIIAGAFVLVAVAVSILADVVIKLSSIKFTSAIAAIGELTLLCISLMGAAIIIGIVGGVLAVGMSILGAAIAAISISVPGLLLGLAQISLVMIGVIALGEIAKIALGTINDIIFMVKNLGQLTTENLVQGMNNGIDNLSDSFFNSVAKLATGAIGVLTGQWDIHSPSKVSFGIGKNFGLGLVNSINTMAPLVGNAAGTMANAGVESTSAELSSGRERISQEETEGYKELYDDLEDQAIEGGTAIGEGVTQSAAASSSEGMNSVGGVLIGGFSGIFDKIIQGFKDVFNGIKNGFTKLKEYITGAIGLDELFNFNGISFDGIMSEITDSMGLSGLMDGFSSLGGSNVNWSSEDQRRLDYLNSVIAAMEANGATNSHEYQAAINQRSALLNGTLAINPILGGSTNSGDYREVTNVEDWLKGFDGAGGGGGGSFDTSGMASDIYGSSGVGSGIGDGSAGSMGSSYVNSNNTYTFVQNNYSPEPLTRADIYLQTQKQFDSWAAYNE